MIGRSSVLQVDVASSKDIGGAEKTNFLNCLFCFLSKRSELSCLETVPSPVIFFFQNGIYIR
jgi:hypothetical protein